MTGAEKARAKRMQKFAEFDAKVAKARQEELDVNKVLTGESKLAG